MNIRLASELTKYDIDVQREGLEEEDVELTEFRDEIEAWIIQEFKNIGLDTAKSVLDASVEELLKRTDLEEEDVELTEFRDEIEAWIIQEFKNIGLDTAKSVLDASCLLYTSPSPRD